MSLKNLQYKQTKSLILLASGYANIEMFFAEIEFKVIWSWLLVKLNGCSFEITLFILIFVIIFN